MSAATRPARACARATAGTRAIARSRACAVACALLAAACAAPTAARAPSVHVPARGALGPYSAAVTAGGFCFLSGKIAPSEARGGAFRTEADAALDAVAAELAGLGLDLADAVAVTVYLTDMALYAELNEAYAARVPAPYPSRATVAVAALPGGARVELAVIARQR
jgi:2-iminobutanoate/2-iminopropanoate deaminase